MKKSIRNTKKLLVSIAIILSLSIGSLAVAYATYDNYYGEFSLGLWLSNDSDGSHWFSLTGSQYCSGSQKPKYTGQPCGVEYQIRDDVWGTDPVYKTAQVWGANSSVYANLSGPTGRHGVYFQNLYSSSYTQIINGKFNY